MGFKKKRIVVLLLFIFALFASLSDAAKSCLGKSHSMSISGSAKDRLKDLKQRYENCTKVDGNLEIVSLDEEAVDLSFLSSIEEVTGYVLFFNVLSETLGLNSLRLIRGEMLYGQNVTNPFTSEERFRQFSLIVYSNYRNSDGLRELGLTSLVEILNGDVYFYNNKLLCNEDSVLWKDILSGPSSTVNFDTEIKSLQCGACADECTEFEGKKYCWGPGQNNCQNFTRVHCKEQCADRCFGTDWDQCCKETCTGGCFGKSSDQCFACHKFSDSGSCVDSCPPPKIYNYLTFLWEENPKVKYAYGHDCLDQCPSHMYIEGGACVKNCPQGQMPGDGRCVPCEGACPKVCSAPKPFLSSKNIFDMEGCTIIDGNLKIVDSTFKMEYDFKPLNMSTLRMLENVTTIEGFLSVDADSPILTDLSFLHNLRIINGKELNGISLLIYKTSLESLGLDSLKTIANGAVFVKNNSRLCFGSELSKLNWTSMLKDHANQRVFVGNNTNQTECEQKGHKCSPECSDQGCFGPLNTQCVSCRSHRQGKECTSSCSGGWYPPSSTPEPGRPVICIKCHEQCRGSCTGTGANQCDECLSYQDGPYCVGECPSSKFPDKDNQCKNCSSSCDGGCYGPSDTFGQPDGCKNCSMVLMDESGTEKEKCIAPNSPCPSGYYNFKSKECHRCHSECTRCFGPGASNCDLTTCKNVIHEKQCFAKCLPNYYADKATKPSQCKVCDENCLGCTGPTSNDCSSCRILKVYHDYGDKGKNPEFNCTAACPEGSPNKIQEQIGTEKNTVCVPDEFAEPSTGQSNSKAGLVAGLIVAALLLLSIVVAIIFFMKRQRTKWDLEKTIIKAKMEGFDDTEPLDITRAAPDKSQLRIIKESELRKEEVVGSGAFGTVYKGVWVPSGENVRIPVAIKVLNEGTSAAQNKELLDEARIMASVDHPNCVRLAAICMANPIQLVTPLMPFGSLIDYIRKQKSNIGSKVLLNWATQIAKGMKYLEERGIVHRDLAARNVLVKNANLVKITDFGLSKLLDVDQKQVETTDGKLPIKWMAMESIRHRIFTHKSDVWSYGVTIWELFTYGQRPYEFLSAIDVLETLEKGERLSQPEICTIDIYMIMIKCWMVDAGSRPSFEELVTEFSKMCRDPGRYLVIKGDELMKLPAFIPDTKDLVSDDGPEPIMLADDYYLQPVQPGKTLPDDDDDDDEKKQASDDNYLEPASKKKKGKGQTTVIDIEGNKYTTDPTEKRGPSIKDRRDEGELDLEINPGSDYDPLSVLVVDEKTKQKGSTSSLTGVGKDKDKLARDRKQRNEVSKSEYLKMSKAPNDDKKAMLAEFEDDTIDEDDYLTSSQPDNTKPSNYYNQNPTEKTKSPYFNSGSKGRGGKNYNVSDV